MLGIGEAKPTTVMLQLADRSTNGKPNCGRKTKAQLNQPAQIPASANIQADIYLTARTHNRERGKFSCPEIAGSQIRVRSASVASSKLGRQLMLPNFILTLPTHYKNPAFTFTIHFCLHLPSSCTPNSPSQKFIFLADMENSQASSPENLPTRFQNTVARTHCYNVVAQKKIWEEQGFFFDDGAENYGLETIIYKRLLNLDWFCLGRKVAQANLSWVREFYAHNATGNDTVEVRGRRIPANSATINSILDLSNNLPSIYELIGALEEEDLDNIKDQLCLPGTEWNTTGKNPGTISRPCLLPEAKLWNTFVKRNIMPTSHNQTVDRTRLLLISAIISGYRFNVHEVIAKELSDSCQNDKGILAFPYIISALCRRATVPNRPSDNFTPLRSGWKRKEYMRKMELKDATPIQLAMPTPSTNHQNPAVEPQAPTPATNIPDNPTRTPEAAASFAPTPPSPPTAHSPSPAPATEAPQPTHIMQLLNQLQRVEAWQLQMIEETKVFHNSLIQFLCFQFPDAACFFSTPPNTAPPPANSTINPSEEAGQTKPVNLSEEDIFDWQTPVIPPTTTPPAHTDNTADPSPARKRKKPAGRTIQADTSSDAADDYGATADFHVPPSNIKRQRHLHVISSNSEDDGNTEPSSSKSLAF
ncbi:hypothetical protein V6N12_012733 [Hibiscus sabdariffa]|uniref:Putative plant transposon protein domain-containing protein n=1 Tax=Hibiscus sabdariffa TaxID=183260 RepID=A0ABR2DF67_9ROSI